MQNRTSTLVSLLTLLVSYYAYVLSGVAYDEAEKYSQRFNTSVDTSPSSVSPVLQARQALLAGSKFSGGNTPESQGGKQESLSITSLKDGFETEHHEAVADLVHIEVLETPLPKKTEIYRWVDNNGTVSFSNQRRGNLEEQ